MISASSAYNPDWFGNAVTWCSLAWIRICWFCYLFFTVCCTSRTRNDDSNVTACTFRSRLLMRMYSLFWEQTLDSAIGSFVVAGPKILNSLPVLLRQPDIEFGHLKRRLPVSLLLRMIDFRILDDVYRCVFVGRVSCWERRCTSPTALL